MRLALRFIAVLLVVTGAAKIFTAHGEADILSEIDPILMIPFRQLLLAAGIAEVMLALYLWIGNNIRRSGAVLLCVALQLAFYRLGLFLIGYRKPCHCLGEVTQWLGITDRTADSMMKLFLVAMILVGLAAMLAAGQKGGVVKLEGAQ